MTDRAHPSPPSHASASAFTLIELLVVIAIVALLVGLLAPALGGARDSARTSLCGSNLRQILIANEGYANDHADRYCPGAADIIANFNRWHGTRASAGAAFSPEGGPLTPYLSTDGSGGGSVAVRACPTFVPTQLALASAGSTGGFERSAGGYGYNNAFVGVERGPGGRLADGRVLWTLVTDRLGSVRSRFADPSGTLGFADAALADGNRTAGIAEYSFAEARFWPDSADAMRPDPSIHFRHQKTRNSALGQVANIGWLDGHVNAARMTFSVPSAIYGTVPADFGIGWFGSVDDNSAYDYH
jgi:prepilin-type N-terminal cleavage/methylation domain-containing protein/prepilin-type processing-associated H-X9-DG protein